MHAVEEKNARIARHFCIIIIDYVHFSNLWKGQNIEVYLTSLYSKAKGSNEASIVGVISAWR